MAMTVNKMRTRVAAAVLAALIFWTPFYAFPPIQASPEHSSSDRLDSSYFKKFGLDFGDVVTSPARWGSGDFLRFSAIVGTGLLIYGFDKEIYDWVQRQKSSASLDASPVISKFGNGGYLTAFMAALYVSGEVFDNSDLRKTALLSLESFLTTTAFVLALKVAVGRARPYTGESSHSFYPFSFSTGHTSFPSGDAAGAVLPSLRSSPINRPESSWTLSPTDWPALSPSIASTTGSTGRPTFSPARLSDFSSGKK
jgi:hypothetical protein